MKLPKITGLSEADWKRIEDAEEQELKDHLASQVVTYDDLIAEHEAVNRAKIHFSGLIENYWLRHPQQYDPRFSKAERNEMICHCSEDRCHHEVIG